MKLLIITNLFPNDKEPTRGIFNKQQFLELAKLCKLKVVAPLPWYYRRDISKEEILDGIETYHPRYFMIPKLWCSLYGALFFISLIGKIKEIYRNFKFDLIFTTWAYPDGFGSFLIAKVLKKPVIIKVHGSDINIYTKSVLRKKMISYALRNSNKVIAVSNALKQKLVAIGVPAEKIRIIPNGVDKELFKPLNQAECRKKLGLPLNKKTILFVGSLVQVKGVDILIDGFGKLVRPQNDILLVLVGVGSLDKMLREKVKTLGIEQNVIFAGCISHDSIRYYMNACDIFCLPSLNEGCPNVLLEAMACGKPVIASKVGGVPDMVTSEKYGILVEPQNAEALTKGLQIALEKKWNNDFFQNDHTLATWESSSKNLFYEIEAAIKMDDI